MATQVYESWPNPLPQSWAPGVATWRVLASDGTDYASIAALQAASKNPYPGLDPGMTIGTCLIRTVATGGGPGSWVLFARDRITAPTDAQAENEVGANDQQIAVSCPFRVLWIRLNTASDRFFCDGRY
jgi:hypothetical protein